MLYLQFAQNEYLLEKLLETEGTTLVEASPHDETWGIGLRESDPAAKNKHTWKGRNLLGYILTDVREQLAKEFKEIKASHLCMMQELL